MYYDCKLTFYRLVYVFMAFAALLVGGLIYVGYRPMSLEMFTWLEALGLREEVYIIRFYVIENFGLIGSIAVYSIPHGLWTFSLTSLIALLWLPSRQDNFKAKIWLGIPLVLSILPELLQATKLFSGTFDLTDLIVNILGYFLGIFTGFLFCRRVNYETSC